MARIRYTVLSLALLCFVFPSLAREPKLQSKPFTKARFEQARRFLKYNFPGNERPIDELLSHIRGWYLNEEVRRFRTTPLIVSVWGITGYGKTTTLNTMLKVALGINDYFYLHMDSFSGTTANAEAMNGFLKQIRSKLTVSEKDPLTGIKLEKIRMPKNVAITLDEFQVLRSLNEDGDRIERPSATQIWDFLGTGMIRVPNPALYSIEAAKAYPHWYCDRPDNWDALSNERKQQYYDKFLSKLEQLEQTLDLQIDLDFSGSIIFLIWQLEDILSVNPTYDSETVTENELHAITSRIGVEDIKPRLRTMYRNEHIRRTGQRHVVIPSLNREGFTRFANRRFEHLRDEIGIDMNVTPLAMDGLLDEVIIPFQGVTPVIDGIDQISVDHLGELLKLGSKKLKLDVGPKPTQLLYTTPGGKQLVVPIPQYKTKTDELDLNPADKYAMALYGAAKVTAMIGLGSEIPRTVRFKYSTNSLSVLVDTHDGSEQVSRLSNTKNFLHDIAIRLAGDVAIESIIGTRTTLSASDLVAASNIARQMIAQFGMAAIFPREDPYLGTSDAPNPNRRNFRNSVEPPAAFGDPMKEIKSVLEGFTSSIEQMMSSYAPSAGNPADLALVTTDPSNIGRDEAQKVVGAARQEAVRILNSESTFLFRLAHLLATKERVTEQEIRQLIGEYWHSEDQKVAFQSGPKSFDCEGELTKLLQDGDSTPRFF